MSQPVGPARDDQIMPPQGSAEDVIALVRRARPRCGEVTVVCLDGPAGSGKTTLAACLSEALDGAPVVHLDDLYRGWEQDLGTVPARLRAWLLDPWADGLPGCHPRYDWAAQRYVEWIELPVAPVVILEGCASAGRAVRNVASVVVWVEADEGVRLARGIARDGAQLADHWLAWQVHEADHFAADDTRASADLIVRT